MYIPEQIHYTNLIRNSGQALEPKPVKLSAEWEALFPKKDKTVLDGIRALLFDIYGTLFVSGAGEIAAGAVSNTNSIPQIPEAMKEYFRQAVIHYHEKAKTAGTSFPEVNVEEIWASYEGPIPSGWELPQKIRIILEKIGPRAARRYAGRELALHFELACNPVYPMPEAEKTLRSLVTGGKKLGIISNAQFYTPLLFNAFFNASPSELGFDPELLIYSFEEKEAKPSFRLFAKARTILEKQNIAAGETLYIGNDMRNDIIPAAEAGFVTALFAGDSRSLRLREGECAGKKPDMVLSDLKTLGRGLSDTDN